MFLERFCQVAQESSSLLLEELWDGAKAFTIEALSSALKTPILVVTDGNENKGLLQDLLYFAPAKTRDFPSWETLPGDEISPSPDLVGRRYEDLFHLLKKESCIVVAPLQAVLQKVLPKEALRELLQEWKVGDTIAFDSLAQMLTEMGYRRENLVSDKGEFALRGGILDLYPLSSYDPYRIEFFGDTIDQIRRFDSATQKSIEKCSSLFLCPADEATLLKKNPDTGSLLDLFDSPPLVVFDDLLALEHRWSAFKALPGARSPLFLSFETFFKSCAKKLYFSQTAVEELSETKSTRPGRALYTGKAASQPVEFSMFDLKIQAERVAHPFERVTCPIPEGFNTQVVISRASQRAVLKERFDLEGPFVEGFLSSGFFLIDAKKAVISASELLGHKSIPRQKWRTSHHIPAAEFHELSYGDLVVHFHNGIGKFLGIEKQKNHLGNEEEFIIIEYASHSKLYVPLNQSHLVSRYIGTSETSPALNALGTSKWQQVKQKAEKAIVGYARDMLALQAQRTSKEGFHYPSDSETMRLFEDDFPYTETEDQTNAIHAIKEDMQSSKIMDRLICGDVGYGKTEVAMRAAFKAVVDGGKQVAVLVPTTVLAMQHYENFKERMKDFPVEIRVLSRFVKPKEVRRTLEECAAGQVDILVGTHRLISKDVHFKDLGLLIIDEEQRFGVKVKEHLKKLKSEIDCLTLSATPIPRTLYMSLMGIRDMSTISSPPHNRLPIKTIIAESDDETIKNGFLRELSRDGQAYYIHNRVETLYEHATRLQKLMPAAKIQCVHGQMSPDEIDETFHLFKTGQCDILLATTILENGIDIPNANTIMIDQAHHFGMADLYQLRGRVGRSDRPAYAYFLVPRHRALPEEARRRLQALVETSGFGGGLKLAMRDLEIRGAGDLLGLSQAGHVTTVGFHLYCKQLKRAIDSMRRSKTASFLETKMEFQIPAKLPEFYIQETSIRLEIYHRLGEAIEAEDVNLIYEELIDRFGKCPSEVDWLMTMTRLRIFGQKHHFILLKFEKLTLLAQRQGAKEVEERRVSLPPLSQAKSFESQVIEKLKTAFAL